MRKRHIDVVSTKMMKYAYIVLILLLVLTSCETHTSYANSSCGNTETPATNNSSNEKAKYSYENNTNDEEYWYENCVSRFPEIKEKETTIIPDLDLSDEQSRFELTNTDEVENLLFEEENHNEKTTADTECEVEGLWDWWDSGRVRVYAENKIEYYSPENNLENTGTFQESTKWDYIFTWNQGGYIDYLNFTLNCELLGTSNIGGIIRGVNIESK